MSKGWVKNVSKGWVKNCVTVKNAKLVKKLRRWKCSGSSCKERTFWSVKQAGLIWEGESLSFSTDICPGSHVPIFFQVHMYQYLSRFTCTNIFSGSYVPIFFQVHMYGSKWFWSRYGVQLPLPSCPFLLWLQSIIPLGLNWIWISFGLNLFSNETASPFWGWIYSLCWDILVSRYLETSL